MNGQQILDAMDDISSRMNDELSSVFLYYLAPEKRDYYQQTALFGEKFKQAFPSANTEVIEAGNCFALGRNTAAVFHVMRAMELVLRALSASLRIPPVTEGWEKNWGKMLPKIKSKIATNDADLKDDPTWSSSKDFYHKAYSFLEGVRQPIRNETMHTESVYDDGGAENVMNAARAFMSHVAERIKE